MNLPNSPHKDVIEKCILNGTIVPSEITVNLLLKAIETNNLNRTIIDGFPRNIENYYEWKKQSKGKVKTIGVVVIEIDFVKE